MPATFKYQIGNHIKVKNHEDREAVIVELSNCGYEDYAIMFLDDGGFYAWLHPKHIEFLDEGGQHLIDLAKQNEKVWHEKQKDITYISENLENGNLSATSILYLYGLVGFKSKFIESGEFATLYFGWEKWEPIFKFIKDTEKWEDCKFILDKIGFKYDALRCWEEFHK